MPGPTYAPVNDQGQWGILAQQVTMAVWDFDAWTALSARSVELARALDARGMVATQCGDFEAATSIAAEKDVINEVTVSAWRRPAICCWPGTEASTPPTNTSPQRIYGRIRRLAVLGG